MLSLRKDDFTLQNNTLAEATRNYKIYCFIFALLYAAILASFPVDVFLDRENYLTFAEFSIVILARNAANGVLAALMNEPVWLGINIILNSVFSPEATVRILIGVPAFTVCYLVLRFNSKFFVFLILIVLMPQVIKNHIIHLRQGVAIAIFMYAWFCQRPLLKYFLYAIAPFVHSSFFFVLLILLVSHLLANFRFGADLRILTYSLMGAAVGGTVFSLASILGARQAESESYVQYEVSGLGFIFWVFVLFIFVMQGKTFLRNNSFVVGTLIFYVSCYFLLPVSGRIFESTIVLLFLASLALTQWRKIAFYMSLMFYTILLWLMKSQLPLMGYGVTDL
ncbi:EpsG family protein [Arsukibacterium indicum]|uniref:EpsG family protein n=1 Tax=Arsukibacterium indicum TaxID=2848612 RepID=A0ABS6MHV8_9GAMM|nr:EpsG family protein [Arsukibacterium indicum]MBV2127802.1 EpsG family protein [Arsukibacterium indicum]